VKDASNPPPLWPRAWTTGATEGGAGFRLERTLAWDASLLSPVLDLSSLGKLILSSENVEGNSDSEEQMELP